MDRKSLKAIVNGKEYTLDSDNRELLSMLEWVKRNKETKKMEDVPYLPIEIVYQLLEQFFPNYSFESRPMEMEKSFVIKKQKYNYSTKQKEEIEEEVMLFKKSVLLILPNEDGTKRELEWTARTVATIWQITVDQMYNGFDLKTESRWLKNACKKLWRVFRIPNDLEEVIEKESIVNDINVDDVVKTKVKEEAPKEKEVSKLEEDITKAFKAKIWDKVPSKEDLQKYGKEIREEMWLTGDGDKLMKEVYKSLKNFYELKTKKDG